MVREEIALSVQGGGTRGVFAAGVLDAFIDNNIEFPYVIGTSAGALLSYNYLAKDKGRGAWLIEECMQMKEFASVNNYLKDGNFFNFDFLMYEVPKSVRSFNQEEFDKSKTRFLCATTGMDDGKAHYFEKGVTPDFMAALAASSSLPIINKPVEVEGHLHMDGGPVASVPFKKPIEDGFRKVVVVLTRDRSYRKKKRTELNRLYTKRKYHRYPEFVKAVNGYEALYNRQMEELFRLEREGKVFIIAPEEKVEIGRVEKDKAKLHALYQKGYDVAIKLLPELKKYIGE